MVGLSQQGMRQILINLVGNAAKFTEQGEIVVRMSWAGDTRTLMLDVADTGIGISEEKMSKLFDPFVQDIASRMRRSGGEIKGTGLGLPIVKRMVENANGTIKATSELGKGTTFHIEIADLTVIDHVSAAPRAAEETIRAAEPLALLKGDSRIWVDVHSMWGGVESFDNWDYLQSNGLNFVCIDNGLLMQKYLADRYAK